MISYKVDTRTTGPKTLKNLSFKKELLIGAGIFLLAMGVRAFYLYQSADNPSFEAPIVDSESYDRMARNVADGKGMNDDFFWQSFFYPVFLSVVYMGTGSSIFWAKVIQLLLGCMTCLLTYRLGRRCFGHCAGVIAGVMTALYGPLIFLEAELLGSGWAAFWAVVVVLLFVKASSGKSIALCFALGICGALSIVTHPTFLPFFAAASVWLIVGFLRARCKWHRIALAAGGILVGFLLVAVPVAMQNQRLTGKIGILPSSGGINFYIGNNPNISETLTARPGWDWEELTLQPREAGVEEDMWEHQKYFYAKVVDFVRKEPLTFARGLIYKAGQFLNSRELPRNVDLYLFGKWSGLLGSLVWKAGKFGFPFGVLLPLCLVGLICSWRRIPAPIKIFLLLYPLSIVLVFVTARYRVPVIPVMSVVAAAGVVNLAGMIRRIQLTRIAGLAMPVAGIVVLSILPGPFPEELPNFEAELYANVASAEVNQGKSEQAIEHLRKALSLQSDYPSVHANLGAALAKGGQLTQAIEHYNLALQFKPDSPEVLANLGSALSETGKITEAIACYNKALQVSPRYAIAYFNLGNLYLGLNKLDDAVKHYEQAIEIKPDYLKAHGNLAVVLARQGKLERAIVHFTETVRLQPGNPGSHHNLAKALASGGKMQEAIKELREAMRLNPNDVVSMDYLARILATDADPAVRDPEQAVLLAEKACRLTTYEHPYLLSTLAQAYGAMERWSEAIVTIDKAIEIASSSGSKQLAQQFTAQWEYYKGKLAEKPKSGLPAVNQ